MNAKHKIITFLSLICIIFVLENCDESTTTNSISDEIQVAIHPICNDAINLSGDRVFASKEPYGADEMLLIYGYSYGSNNQELDIFLPWPPVNGTYDMASPDVIVVYDPLNSGNDSINGLDQYSSVTSAGQVELVNFELDGDDVLSASLTFSNILVASYDSNGIAQDTLCLNSGTMKAR